MWGLLFTALATADRLKIQCLNLIVEVASAVVVAIVENII